MINKTHFSYDERGLGGAHMIQQQFLTMYRRIEGATKTVDDGVPQSSLFRRPLHSRFGEYWEKVTPRYKNANSVRAKVDSRPPESMPFLDSLFIVQSPRQQRDGRGSSTSRPQSLTRRRGSQQQPAARRSGGGAGLPSSPRNKTTQQQSRPPWDGDPCTKARTFDTAAKQMMMESMLCTPALPTTTHQAATTPSRRSKQPTATTPAVLRKALTPMELFEYACEKRKEELAVEYDRIQQRKRARLANLGNILGLQSDEEGGVGEGCITKDASHHSGGVGTEQQQEQEGKRAVPSSPEDAFGSGMVADDHHQQHHQPRPPPTYVTTHTTPAPPPPPRPTTYLHQLHNNNHTGLASPLRSATASPLMASSSPTFASASGEEEHSDKKGTTPGSDEMMIIGAVSSSTDVVGSQHTPTIVASSSPSFYPGSSTSATPPPTAQRPMSASFQRPLSVLSQQSKYHPASSRPTSASIRGGGDATADSLSLRPTFVSASNTDNPHQTATTISSPISNSSKYDVATFGLVVESIGDTGLRRSSSGLSHCEGGSAAGGGAPRRPSGEGSTTTMGMRSQSSPSLRRGSNESGESGGGYTSPRPPPQRTNSVVMASEYIKRIRSRASLKGGSSSTQED